MTLKDFIENNNIEGFELVEDVLMNVFSNGTPYGLDVDTSNIEAGTPLTYTDEYLLEDNMLYVNGIEYDTEIINLL